MSAPAPTHTLVPDAAMLAPEVDWYSCAGGTQPVARVIAALGNDGAGARIGVLASIHPVKRAGRRVAAFVVSGSDPAAVNTIAPRLLRLLDRLGLQEDVFGCTAPVTCDGVSTRVITAEWRARVIATEAITFMVADDPVVRRAATQASCAKPYNAAVVQEFEHAASLPLFAFRRRARAWSVGDVEVNEHRTWTGTTFTLGFSAGDAAEQAFLQKHARALLARRPGLLALHCGDLAVTVRMRRPWTSRSGRRLVAELVARLAGLPYGQPLGRKAPEAGAPGSVACPPDPATPSPLTHSQGLNVSEVP